MTTMNELSEFSLLAEVSPKIIEMRLSLLIRQYLKVKTKSVAHAVVRQLELLLSHPDCIGYPNERCGYKKMLMQWREIAA